MSEVMTHRVAVIGTGADPDERTREGFAMAYRHAPGYRHLDSCELVACADIVPEHAAAFAESFDVPGVYTDHARMLEVENPDIVSICVPPGAHAELVVDCAEADSVRAVHCEKPMATTWGDCQTMVRRCNEQNTQLTIDHQRRFARPVQQAKRLLEEDTIGRLQRLEWSEANLFDGGSHLFDLCDYFLDGERPRWALAGVETHPDNRWFGALNEVQAVAQWEDRDGTQGFASTAEGDRQTLVDAYLRLVGEDGVIEIQADEGVPLRVRTSGDWEDVDTGGESVYGPGRSRLREVKAKVSSVVPGLEAPDSPASHYERAIAHLVTSLEEGTEPIISGRRVLRGTELVFACWESARTRGRVDLPLDITDNPLEELCAEPDGESAEHTDRHDERTDREADPAHRRQSSTEQHG